MEKISRVFHIPTPFWGCLVSSYPGGLFHLLPSGFAGIGLYSTASGVNLPGVFQCPAGDAMMS